jgi:hypothetical protein
MVLRAIELDWSLLDPTPLYAELQHVADMGQKSHRQKVALRPNGYAK